MKSRNNFERILGVLAVSASCMFAGQAVAADAAPVGDIQAAQNKISMCIGCHGIDDYRVAYPELYEVPMIAGQNAQYIVAALKEYASGARTFPTMEAIARGMSEQDMADVAAYYSSLKK
ncbi:MAG: cytochrome c [Alcaligenaceae bacterium]|nr:cytochrome c [Alcaligenaceae bacterium]